MEWIIWGINNRAPHICGDTEDVIPRMSDGFPQVNELIHSYSAVIHILVLPETCMIVGLDRNKVLDYNLIRYISNEGVCLSGFVFWRNCNEYNAG